LWSLDLTGCTGLTDVSGLSGLTNLWSLDLTGCTGLTDVSGLSGLTNLWRLNLSGCTGLTGLFGLSGLTKLNVLDVSGCTGLKFIYKFPDSLLILKLCNLNLRPNGFTDDILRYVMRRECRRQPQPEFLYMSPLPISLQRLDLSGCSGFERYPEIGKLLELQILDLCNCKDLVFLPDLCRSRYIGRLNLRGTRFVDGLNEDLIIMAGKEYGSNSDVVALLDAIRRKDKVTEHIRDMDCETGSGGGEPATKRSNGPLAQG
jgi:internalin A